MEDQDLFDGLFAEASAEAEAAVATPAQPEHLSTLYRKTSAGALQMWRVWTEGAVIVTEYGQVGGQLQIARKTAKPKNVGRSNATTGEQQAEIEAKAMWKHQVERKYRRTVEETEDLVFLPMLAKNWKDVKKLEYPVDVQPKLDGVRCLVILVGGEIALTSRQGKPYNVPHLKEQLKNVVKPGEVLDGEIYIHGVGFQALTKLIRKQRPESVNLEWHCYDMPTPGEDQDDWNWTHRRGAWACFGGRVTEAGLTHIKMVPTFEAENAKQVKDLQKKFIATGYEGAMVRVKSGLYVYGGSRSSDLLKVKDFIDREYKVIGHEVEVKEGENSNGPFHYDCVMWVCDAGDGKTFPARPKGSLEERQEDLKTAMEQYGLMYKVQFFEYTDDGLPRFPVGLGFRLPEDL